MGESDDEFVCNKCKECDVHYLNRVLANDDYCFLSTRFTGLRLVFKIIKYLARKSYPQI